MNTLRGRLLVDGKLMTGSLRWQGAKIERVEIEGEIGGADLPIVAPGLIDLHVHGFGGFDPLEDVEGMARALARAGTTAFQPTLFPAAPALLGRQAESVWTSAQQSSSRGARVVGLHLEGPFVNPEAAGALQREDLATPSVSALNAILGSSSGSGRGVRTMTIAPELAGSTELIDELVRSNVRVSLGHSRATAAEARSAARAGARGATHLFNAMPPLHHREVGLAGFALTDAALFAEIIGDLVHVGAEAIELALRARGAGGLCLVSDALRGAGTGCDVFHWRGREHFTRDGAAYYAPNDVRDARRDANETPRDTSGMSRGAHDMPRDDERARDVPRLAGSASSQLEMVRKLSTRGVIGVPEALTMASTSPARALALDRELGELRAGLAADFIALRGRELELEQVWVAGEPIL
jgi:N-acetylglucosamine-6-phosphate deacetylase